MGDNMYVFAKLVTKDRGMCVATHTMGGDNLLELKIVLRVEINIIHVRSYFRF